MSGNLHEISVDWRAVEQLIQSANYVHAADLLRYLQMSAAAEHASLQAATAAAVRQIVLACAQCRTDAARYQLALQETNAREQQLRIQAQTLLEAMSSKPKALMGTPLPFDTLTSPAPQWHNPMQQKGWRYRLYAWLEQRLRAFLAESEQHFLPLPETQPEDLPAETLAELSELDTAAHADSQTAAAETVGHASTGPDPVADSHAEEESPLIDPSPTEQLLAPARHAPMVDELVVDEPVADDRVADGSEPDCAIQASECAAAGTPALEVKDEDKEVADRVVADSAIADRELADEEVVKGEGPPSLAVYCLGVFRVYQDEQAVEEWPSSKGQAIFKYLLLHRARPIAKEVLMDLFWPEAAPDAARNNLNVAIYGLRRALRSGRPNFSHVLFQSDCYLLNPELTLWVDVEEFDQQLTSGRQAEAAGDAAAAFTAYHAAEALYQSELLSEDRYEDWIFNRRQYYQEQYLHLLDYLSQYYLARQAYELCANIVRKQLAVDGCQEEAHRRLMLCHSRQGQLHLALRQYHQCVETLARELDVEPSPATTDLYHRLRRQKG
ncbi:MAG: BTAD domain-containing putative transcriptional regulator [Caldilineaceae bacterium]